MGENLYLDRDAYLQAQKTIQGVDQSLSNTYTMLNNLNFRNLREEHDYYGELSQAMTKFVIAKRRIGDLHEAMGDYLVAWDDAQDKARRQAGNVQVVTDRYSDQIFWNLYTDRILEGNQTYENSKAWKYVTTSEKSFSEQYSDFNNFIYKSGYWPETALLIRDLGSWRQSTIKGLDGDLYYDPLLNASLEGMLKGLPGYTELDTVDTDIIDWDKLGEMAQIPGFKKLVEKLASFTKKTGKSLSEVDPEEFEELAEGFYKLAEQWADYPGYAKIAEVLGDGMSAFNPKALQMAGATTEEIMKVQEFAEFGLKIMLHCASDHSQQIEYLENAKEALLAAGYDESSVVSNLSYLQTLYENNDLYVAQKTYEKLKELGISAADKLVGKLPVVTDIDKTYGFLASLNNMANADKLKAANSMMGIIQYEGALMQTFDRYSQMINAGVATQEDMVRAEQVFEMLCTTKIKGYEDMMTIIGDRTAPGYIMAHTKCNELREMMGMPPTKFPSLFSSREGSSGGGASGGAGRRG